MKILFYGCDHVFNKIWTRGYNNILFSRDTYHVNFVKELSYLIFDRCKSKPGNLLDFYKFLKVKLKLFNH